MHQPIGYLENKLSVHFSIFIDFASRCIWFYVSKFFILAFLAHFAHSYAASQRND
jgi:hypothetical protein